jgi:hypothetical protein
MAQHPASPSGHRQGEGVAPALNQGGRRRRAATRRTEAGVERSARGAPDDALAREVEQELVGAHARRRAGRQDDTGDPFGHLVSHAGNYVGRQGGCQPTLGKEDRPGAAGRRPAGG